MNVAPECIGKDNPEFLGECAVYDAGLWVVFDKTKCTHVIVCYDHLDQALVHGHVYVLYPAKDYPIHGGHDLSAEKEEGTSICQICGEGKSVQILHTVVFACQDCMTLDLKSVDELWELCKYKTNQYNDPDSCDCSPCKIRRMKGGRSGRRSENAR